MTIKRNYLNACLGQSVNFLQRSYASPNACMTAMQLKLHLVAIRMKTATVTLPDGYNGNTEVFYAVPMERDGDLLKLQCAAPGKQFLFTWRAECDVKTALEAHYVATFRAEREAAQKAYA
ncbi:hypothetical protein [Pseudomonas sp. BF-R-21]|uniref:hypothetical protein n=1 Tax=Pseudomonas sp. BF-R-21 TaxID=2832387 RepID=UPI001CC134AF|nr:hypothetical protein [Pseudomonas sp. BF-R-21]